VPVFGFSLMLAAASQMTASPSPPAPTYHPQEGPYLVFVDADGTLDTSHVSRIIEGWSHQRDERLGAFLLCLRSQDLGPRAERAALAGTALALSEAGATAVLIGTSSVCKALPVVLLAGGLSERNRVEVRGLLYP
jgi:hypothetical protein